MKKIFALLEFLNDKIFFPIRFKINIKSIEPFLEGSKSILDIGTSDGRLVSIIEKDANINFFGTDKNIPKKRYLQCMVKCDGKRLSFKDNTFNCVTIIDMLHHDGEPNKIVVEANRVSKEYVVIKDHYWINRLDFLLLIFADYIGNAPYKIDLPYNFFTIQSLLGIVKNNKLSLIKFKLYFNPFKHIVLKLKKNNS